MGPRIANSLSGVTLPGYQLFLDHFKKARGTEYTPDQFGWMLGVNALVREDADIVMGFLGDLARRVGAERLSIDSPPEGQDFAPLISLRGLNFPDTYFQIQLCFRDRPQAVFSNARAESSRLWINPQSYEGTEDHQAWKEVLYELSNSGANKLGEIRDENRKFERIGVISDDNNKTVRFYATTDSYCNMDRRSNLPEILDNIMLAGNVVRGAYHATSQLPELQKHRVGTLADRLRMPSE